LWVVAKWTFVKGHSDSIIGRKHSTLTDPMNLDPSIDFQMHILAVTSDGSWASPYISNLEDHPPTSFVSRSQDHRELLVAPAAHCSVEILDHSLGIGLLIFRCWQKYWLTFSFEGSLSQISLTLCLKYLLLSDLDEVDTLLKISLRCRSSPRSLPNRTECGGSQ
jgi:hypothetical protein